MTQNTIVYWIYFEDFLSPFVFPTGPSLVYTFQCMCDAPAGVTHEVFSTFPPAEGLPYRLPDNGSCTVVFFVHTRSSCRSSLSVLHTHVQLAVVSACLEEKIATHAKHALPRGDAPSTMTRWCPIYSSTFRPAAAPHELNEREC